MNRKRIILGMAAILVLPSLISTKVDAAPTPNHSVAMQFVKNTWIRQVKAMQTLYGALREQENRIANLYFDDNGESTPNENAQARIARNGYNITYDLLSPFYSSVKHSNIEDSLLLKRLMTDMLKHKEWGDLQENIDHAVHKDFQGDTIEFVDKLVSQSILFDKEKLLRFCYNPTCAKLCGDVLFKYFLPKSDSLPSNKQVQTFRKHFGRFYTHVNPFAIEQSCRKLKAKDYRYGKDVRSEAYDTWYQSFVKFRAPSEMDADISMDKDLWPREIQSWHNGFCGEVPLSVLREQMKQAIAQYASQKERPSFFRIIDRKFGGRVSDYVDNLFAHSFLTNESSLRHHKKWMSYKSLQKDPGFNFIWSCYAFEWQLIQHD